MMRSLYLALLEQPEDFPDREAHIRLIQNALNDLKPY
jgi:hypothetical protein